MKYVIQTNLLYLESPTLPYIDSELIIYVILENCWV